MNDILYQALGSNCWQKEKKYLESDQALYSVCEILLNKIMKKKSD